LNSGRAAFHVETFPRLEFVFFETTLHAFKSTACKTKKLSRHWYCR